MDQPTPDSFIMAKYAALVAGFFGSALSIAYAKPATKTQAVTGFALGCAIAYFGTPVAMHLIKAWIPADLDYCVAFFLGFTAYRAVPAFLAFVDRLRDIRLPFSG